MKSFTLIILAVCCLPFLAVGAYEAFQNTREVSGFVHAEGTAVGNSHVTVAKVFEFGGPYIDILDKTSREAKTDIRLKSLGKLIGFRFYNVDWELEPKTAFYDWLYLNALKKNFELTKSMANYSAFTDIEFNPMKSISCQARSAALHTALEKRNLLDEALSSKDNFLYILKNSFSKEDNHIISQQDFHYS